VFKHEGFIFRVCVGEEKGGSGSRVTGGERNLKGIV
jgi:hypothetical protein